MPSEYDILTNEGGFLDKFEQAHLDTLSARDTAVNSIGATGGVDYVVTSITERDNLSASSGEVALVLSGNTGEFYEWDGSAWGQKGPTLRDISLGPTTVSQLSDLRSTSASSTGELVQVSSDNGGLFVAKASDPFGNGDDGATALQASDGTWWVRREALADEPIKAKWYGLEEGSGVDNTSALQTALDHFLRVELPDGDYGEISTPITLRAGHKITSDGTFRVASALGSGVTDDVFKHTIDATVETTTSASIAAKDRTIPVNDESAFSVGDLIKLDDSDSAGSGNYEKSEYCVIAGINAGEILTSNPIFYQHGSGKDIERYDQDPAPSVSGVDITLTDDEHQGMLIQGINPRVANCTMRAPNSAGRRGIKVFGKNPVAENCRGVSLTYSQAIGQGYGVSITGVGGTVRGGTFENVRHPVTSPDRSVLSKALRITDVQVVGHDGTQNTIDLHANVAYSSIQGCTISNGGILIRSGYVTVHDNEITNNGAASTALRLLNDKQAIHKRVKITENRIIARGNSNPALWLQEAITDSVVKGNHVIGRNMSASTFDLGRGAGVASKNSVIEENYVSSDTQTTVRLFGGDDLRVFDNTFISKSGNPALVFRTGNATYHARRNEIRAPSNGNAAKVEVDSGLVVTLARNLYETSFQFVGDAPGESELYLEGNTEIGAQFVGADSGSESFDGDGSKTTFTIPHNLNKGGATGRAPTVVQFWPESADAAGNAHVSNKGDGSFDITFASAPPSGTGNVVIGYKVERV